MSENLEALERRTRSVRGIRSVVHTMKTLSAINATPCEQAARAITQYLDVVVTGLRGLLQTSATGQQPSSSSTTPRFILALGTDHGLCGNYNELVADRVALEFEKALSSQDSSKHTVICVGAQLENALSHHNIICERALFAPSGIDGITRLAGDLVAETDRVTTEFARETVHIQMIYAQPLQHGQQRVVADTLLPLEEHHNTDTHEHPSDTPFRPWYRQSEASLLTALLRNYLYASICRAAADALLTENRARLARMRQAEDAVDEQLTALTKRSRSARQQRITEELQDVVAGFEAVQHVHT